MNNPNSTYRLQFNKNFRFEDARKLVSYFEKLGVGTIYASPVLEAVQGSLHGYNGIHPHHINSEIGTRKELEQLCNILKEKLIGWLQDIVPNHMAYDSSNPWLVDVLEKGRQSPFSGFFDIRWSSNEPIMAPFLGTDLDSAVSEGIIKLIMKQGRLFFNFSEQNYPVNPALYRKILHDDASMIPLPSQPTGNEINGTPWESYINKLSENASDPVVSNHIQSCLDRVNNSVEFMLELLNEQFYKLCYWQLAHEKINYRRFFTVSELICLNIQDKKVFDAYHQTILQMVEAGFFQGLRIDHIDGMYDPVEYLDRLRKVAGKETYIVVEKILEYDEVIPKTWPVQGETGYGFLAMVNNLLTYGQNEKEFTRFYRSIGSDTAPIAQQIKAKKEFILYQRMAGELENLFLDLKYALESLDLNTSHFDPNSLKKAIGSFLVEIPVYRFYGREMPLPTGEAMVVAHIFDSIIQSQEGQNEASVLLKSLLLEETGKGNLEFNERMLHFYRRMMQISGPLMAKGVEDTLMYTYNRFIGHNEVGDSLELFGIEVSDWHYKMRERMARHPLSMNTTSTHDTKRGEDVRARLNVITAIPGVWFEKVAEFFNMNQELKTQNSPDLNDEYFIYLTLLGMYPMPGQPDEDVAERLQKYIPKALREAKIRTNWSDPEEDYEEKVSHFALSLLDKSRPFWTAFTNLHSKISDFGIINSISQLILKCTCPGLPDIYQGTELWDLSLVDPDNRKPVDYDKIEGYLREINEMKQNNSPGTGDVLWNERYNGKIKLWLTQLLLSYRRENQDLFLHGDYIPLDLAGTYQKHLLAYARKYKNRWIMVVVPLYLPLLCNSDETMIRKFDWQDTKVILPPNAPVQWKDLTDEKNIFHTEGDYQSQGMSSIDVNKLFQGLPVAIVEGEKKTTGRKAGVLLHLTSLPAGYGTGDMGPEAYSFARFLCRSGQRYWQMLPINPTDENSGFSPYGSNSAMAGNIMLISPEKLVEQNFLPADEINNISIGNEERAGFIEALELKNRLLSSTWDHYLSEGFRDHKLPFEEFCESESYWLDDYAMYVILKDMHKNLPWFKWPVEYKKRYQPALDVLRDDFAGSLNKVKWYQYIFFRQWKELRDYCRQLDIELFGDMPIYVSHDSVDVWTDPRNFSLDEEGEPVFVGGVPPDYFSEDGQLWGMPVFNWEAMKKNGYAWWKKRIKRNMELFDLIRIDHFRAFANYWSVPAHHKTAKDGEWKDGPGMDLFDALEKEFGRLPLVAEDLGDIDESVHILRRKANMPGMKVLQFAFGDDMPLSEYIPHNHSTDTFAYTGTHDNNTTVGWYKGDISVAHRERLSAYNGSRVDEENVHRVLTRLAYASVSQTAIIPMQDILGLGEEAMMNKPGSANGNWLWRMKKGMADQNIAAYLRWMTSTFGRL
jgi:malto-oligosyltrehalose synthase/4-alpha-glucanotransferase